MVNRLCFFELPSPRPRAAACAFYRAVFDWHISADATEDADADGDAADDGYQLIRAEKGGPPIGGIVPRAEVGQGAVIYVTVASLDAALAKVDACGGRVVEARTMLEGVGWAALVADPDGNAIGIVEEDAEAQPA